MAPSTRRFVFLLLLGVGLGAPGNAEADDASPVTARELFQRGVKAVELGDLAGALAHFQEAYDQSPNQTVLFNIAQTHIALGRPVEGVRALRHYVELDGTAKGNARGRRVRELLEYTERRLGKIAIEVSPSDAALELDGIAETPDTSGLVEVALGTRQLVISRPGFQTAVQRVTILPGETAHVRLELSPVPEPPPSEPPVTKPEKGELRISVSQPGARVLVDGGPLGSPSVLPGTYVIEVDRKGYQPWRKNVEVEAGQTRVVTALLDPAPPPPESDGARQRRFWSIVSGVTGTAFVGGGVLLLVANHSRYRDYRRDHDAFSNELASGVSKPDHPARAASLESRAARIQRTDDLGTGMTVLGGLLLVVSGTLFQWDLELGPSPR